MPILMCSITFVLRPSRKGREFEGRLFIRLIRNRRSRSITTPYKIYPNEWDSRHHRLIYTGCDPVRRRELSSIEQEISLERQRIEEIIYRLEEEGRCSASSVCDTYRLSKDKKSLSVFTCNLCHSLQLEGRERTSRAYSTVTRGLLSYMEREDIPLSQIDATLLQSFERYLKECGRAANTISYYMRNLRAIYNKGVEQGLISGIRNNPFGRVYTGVRSTRKRALNRRSLLRLYELDVLSDVDREKAPRLYEQRQGLLDAQRLFFFSFHARGISFVDMAYLRKDNIRGGVLSYYRKKTGRQIEVKISPAMQSIINSFSERVRHSPYLFPIINGTKKNARLQYESGLRLQNIRLEKLAHLARVEEKVTTHVARHSWATMAKGENLPLWVISEGLGHSNEKTTYTYLASFERSVLDLAGERISTLVQRHKSCHF